MKFDDQKNKNVWWREAFEIFVQTSGWIVGPIIVAIFFGQWLDERYQKGPWLLALCVAMAFIVTNVGLIRMAIKASRKMEKIVKTEKPKAKNIE